MIKIIFVVSLLVILIIVQFVGLYYVDEFEKDVYKKMDKKMAEDCHKTLFCKLCKHFKNGVCPFYEENHYIPDVDYEEDSNDSNHV